jgi:hypothetical protein
MAIRVLDDKHLEIEPHFMSPCESEVRAGWNLDDTPNPNFRCLEWQCRGSNSIDVWQRSCCCLWLGSNCFDPAILPPCFFFPSDLDAGFFALVPEAPSLPLPLLIWLLLELRLVLVPELLDRLVGMLEPTTPRLDMPAEGSTTSTQVRANVNQQGPHNFAMVVES